MDAIKRKFLLIIGWIIIIIGSLLGVVPGPGGIPIVAAGAMIVLSQSRPARRWFVRLQHRYPKVFGPIRKLIARRKRQVRAEKKAEKQEEEQG